MCIIVQQQPTGCLRAKSVHNSRPSFQYDFITLKSSVINIFFFKDKIEELSARDCVLLPHCHNL